MSMTYELVISITSLVGALVAMYFSFKGDKRTDTRDVAARVAERTEINTKLNILIGNMNDIKNDISSINKDVQDLKERMAVVESKIKE